MHAEMAKLAAVECRLRDVIRTIVQQRTSPGIPLSWRLMFEIEDEAITTLQRAPELDLHYLNMMAPPSAQRPPGTERLTDLYACMRRCG